MSVPDRKIRVLCVDDHAFLAEGLRARFALERDLEYAGRLPSAEGLVQEVQRQQPDIVLLDIEMPGPDPFEAAAEVRRLCPRSRVVFLSAYVRDHYVSAAFKAGAFGYFSKSDETEHIVDGLRKVSLGQFAFGPKVAERVKPAVPLQHGPAAGDAPRTKLDSLSNRELEVLRLIGRGLSRGDIARTLHRSPKTIDGHRERIMKKLDIHTNPELIRFAISEGLAES